MEQKKGIDERIEELALIAKGLGHDLRFKLYEKLLKNKNQEVLVIELSKMVGSSYRNVQVHLQFLVNAGLVRLDTEAYPTTVRILKSVHIFEKRVMTSNKEEIRSLDIHESIKNFGDMVLFSDKIADYEEVTDREKIVRIANGLGHKTRIYIMVLFSILPLMQSITMIEKKLRGTPYESSNRNVSQHIDKMAQAGIVHILKEYREKCVYVDKVIKIETRDVI
ncbi:MAG: hypothetical protein OIN85_08635 [Candidatus Methanoperedens sp.]|nr:hypothetical protein [Candidatus Methanoperedens sp.]